MENIFEFCLMIILVFILNYAKGSKPYFLDTVQNVSAPIGRDAHLNCSVMGARGYKVAWLSMSLGVVLTYQEKKFSDHPRVEIRHSSSSSGVDSFILTLKDITKEDEGQFVCQVNTKEGLNRNYTLSIVVSPKIKDKESSGDVIVREGESTVLRCKAEGTPNPEITWRREDMSLIRLENEKVPSVSGEELLLSKIQRSDSGPYLCIAKNGVLPSVSKRIQLNVRFHPKIRATNLTNLVSLGEDVTMSCIVDGYPTPNMFWFKNGVAKSLNYKEDDPMNQRRKYEHKATWRNETQNIIYLTIKNVIRSDFGNYRCFANNSEGSSEAKLILRELRTTTTTSTTTTSTTTTTTTTTEHATTLYNVYHQQPKYHYEWRPGIGNNMTWQRTTQATPYYYISGLQKHNDGKLGRKLSDQQSSNSFNEGSDELDSQSSSMYSHTDHIKASKVFLFVVFISLLV